MCIFLESRCQKKEPKVPTVRVLKLCPSFEILHDIVSCWLKNFCLVIDKYRNVTPVENIVGIKAAYKIGIDITTLSVLSISVLHIKHYSSCREFSQELDRPSITIAAGANSTFVKGFSTVMPLSTSSSLLLGDDER